MAKLITITNDPPYTPIEFFLFVNEDALTKRFIEDNASLIRYCIDFQKYFYFDGTCWKWDSDGLFLGPLVKQTAKLFDYHYERCDDKQELQLAKFIIKYQKANNVRSVLNTAKFDPHLHIKSEELDSHPELLVVKNGTINLKTKKFRASNPDDYLTRKSNIEYSKSAEHPLFDKFIDDITDGDSELKNYLFKLLGYFMTGLTREQKIYIFFGLGANGKSVLLEILRHILGPDLAIQVDSKTLILNNRIIPEDVARLQGSRLITCAEISKDATLNETLVKSLTGGDKITARKLHENSKEFTNTGKPVISTNYLPEIAGNDHGIKRRIQVIPFDKRFDDKNSDPELLNKLKKESEGILALLVESAHRYYQEGLEQIPEKVTKATQNYLLTSNHVRCFVDDCLKKSTDSSARIYIKPMFERYKKYCEDNGFKPLGLHQFGRMLPNHGIEQGKSGPTRFWEYMSFSINPNNCDEASVAKKVRPTQSKKTSSTSNNSKKSTSQKARKKPRRTAAQQATQ